MIPIASAILKDLFKGLDKDLVIKLAKGKDKDPVYITILFMKGKVGFKILISGYIQR